jgi:hypothetical protein
VLLGSTSAGGLTNMKSRNAPSASIFRHGLFALVLCSSALAVAPGCDDEEKPATKVDARPSDGPVIDAKLPDAATTDAKPPDAGPDQAAGEGGQPDALTLDASDATDGGTPDAPATDAPADAAPADAPATDTPAADAPATDALAAIKHRLLMVDNGASKLLLLDQIDPSKSWTVTIPGGSRDLQLIGTDKVLVSHGNGAAEYLLATGAPTGWAVTSYAGVSTAQRLANGRTLIGWSVTGKMTFSEVDTAGAEVAKVEVNGLNQLRLARRLASGNTLFTGERAVGEWIVFEVDGTGAIVWEKPLAGKGYVALRNAGGNTLATTGATVTLTELTPGGTTAKLWGGTAAHPTARLQWFSGFQVLGNGNVVIANWLGDGKLTMGPHAVEFDADNKLVWQWEDHTAAMTVTNLLVLE